MGLLCSTVVFWEQFPTIRLSVGFPVDVYGRVRVNWLIGVVATASTSTVLPTFSLLVWLLLQAHLQFLSFLYSLCLFFVQLTAYF